jgi:hypothetical protein
MGRQSVPTGINPFAKFVQLHFTVNDFAKQALPLVGADRNKVRAGGGVIVSFQADRSPVMFLRIIFHEFYPCIWSTEFPHEKRF